jgi:hypothetical protein
VRAGLGDVPRVSDPGLAHYRAFGLDVVGIAALVNPQLWLRGTQCALRHGFGLQPTHVLRQLPGVFVVRGRSVLAAYRHSSTADRPDYLALVAAASRVTMA